MVELGEGLTFQGTSFQYNSTVKYMPPKNMTIKQYNSWVSSKDKLIKFNKRFQMLTEGYKLLTTPITAYESHYTK